MGTRGPRPTATILRIQTGNPGHRPIPEGEPTPEGSPEKPKCLKGRASVIWDEFIARCFWLTWADSPKAAMWCALQAEFDRAPSKMTSPRIGQLRVLGSELGFDPSARARMGTKGSHGNPKDPAEKYFGRKA